jgi:hypothetical protein
VCVCVCVFVFVFLCLLACLYVWAGVCQEHLLQAFRGHHPSHGRPPSAHSLCVYLPQSLFFSSFSRRQMLEPVRPEAVLPNKALCLQTSSHYFIVNKTSLSLSPLPRIFPPLLTSFCNAFPVLSLSKALQDVLPLITSLRSRSPEPSPPEPSPIRPRRSPVRTPRTAVAPPHARAVQQLPRHQRSFPFLTIASRKLRGSE